MSDEITESSHIAITEMVPDLIWVLDIFGSQEIWSPQNFSLKKFGPTEIWSLHKNHVFFMQKNQRSPRPKLHQGLVLKGVSSKPSGNLIVAPILCFQSQRLQILFTCLFFKFPLPVQSFSNIGKHFIRVPPLMFCDFVIYQKFKGGTIIKCLISMLFNQKKRQVAKV